MKRKNKIMLALAIGAVVLAVGSGAARCSVAPPETEPADSHEAGEVVSHALEQASTKDPGGAQRANAQGGFADLKNTTWETEDGKSTLSIIEGALVEEGEDGSTILYYALSAESLDEETLTATLLVSPTMTGDEQETVAVVRYLDDGSMELTCDKLKAKYVQKAAESGPIAIQGDASELYEMFGRGQDDVERVLTEAARSGARSATVASWSKEVWVDFGNDTYLTNFTLNDAASTIVSVQLDQSGELSAL